MTDIKTGDTVVLTFVYGDRNITQTLPEEEASAVIDILDGRILGLLSFDIPSCGFSEDVSFKVGGRVYAIARDTCNGILDCSTQRHFEVSQGEIDYIHALFEKYGGCFPCV